MDTPTTASLDGDKLYFEEGDTLLQFIDRHRGRGHVPTLCDAARLKPFGACRVCSVEVAAHAGAPVRVVASCHTRVAAGMQVFTESVRIRRLRRNLIELVLTDHPLDCLTCEVNGNCELQTVAAKVGVRMTRYPVGANHMDRRKDQSHVFMTSDLAKCINCARCVRACDEIQGEFVLSMHGRGFDSRIIKGMDQNFADSPCVACGACVQACPTSAISDVFQSKSIEATKRTRTVCTYCGVGCNLIVATKGDEVLSIQAAPDGPVNPSHACLKGRYAFRFYNHADRLRNPMLRINGHFQDVTWDDAYACIVGNLRRIMQAHGPQAIGGISSARCTNEENYLMQKFMRAVIGCNNIDSCARVCHSPSAFGMQRSFGTGAATNGFHDIDQAACIMVIGANPTEAHPVTGARIKQRVMKGVPLIVIDPRVIGLSPYAKYHLQLRPGANLALLNLMARFILESGWVDWDFVAGRCEDWEGFEAGLMALDIDQMERVTGVDRELVRAAALEYAQADAAMCFHGLGVTEHEQGAKTVMQISNLAMMTGNIGHPGMGVNPLRGQNNVQGAADMGCQPHQGPGYLDVLDPAIRRLHGEIYGAELTDQPGMKIPEMLDAAIAGKLQALWLMGEDLVQSNPDSEHVKQAIASLDFLVVQDLFLTETAKFANVVLPAASCFEKSGTFTNAERRVQRVMPAVRPFANSRSDGRVLCEIMRRFGYPQADYSPEGVLAEISRIVPFFRGASWSSLGNHGKQWPIHGNGTDSPILHADRFAHGLGRFHFFAWQESREVMMHGGEFPFILTTGRLLEQYNCGTMTRRSGNSGIVNEDRLSIHPADAKRKCIRSGDRVRIRSARGELVLTALVTDGTKPGVLYTTFHFPEALVNRVIGGGHDAETKCPEYKVVAVDVARADWLPGREAGDDIQEIPSIGV